MKVVAFTDLKPGLTYRIHWNVNEHHNSDFLGTFVDRVVHFARFYNLNMPHPSGRRITPGPVLYDSHSYTFYESGKTLKDKKEEKEYRLAVKRVLNGEVGLDGNENTKLNGIGLGNSYIAGRRRRRTRRR